MSSDPNRGEATYPVGEYIRSASDAAGRSTSIKVTVPPQYARVAAAMVAHGYFGFRTSEDVYRFCIDYGQQLLAKRIEDKEVNALVSTIHSWKMSIQHQLEYKYFLDMYNEIEKGLRDLSRGAPEKALELARRILSQLDSVDDPDWNKRFRAMALKLVRRFRELDERDR